jgi:hypothetical protein
MQKLVKLWGECKKWEKCKEIGEYQKEKKTTAFAEVSTGKPRNKYGVKRAEKWMN